MKLLFAVIIVIGMMSAGCNKEPSAVNMLAEASMKNSEAIIDNTKSISILHEMFKEQIKINATLDKRLRELERRD